MAIKFKKTDEYQWLKRCCLTTRSLTVDCLAPIRWQESCWNSVKLFNKHRCISHKGSQQKQLQNYAWSKEPVIEGYPSMSSPTPTLAGHEASCHTLTWGWVEVISHGHWLCSHEWNAVHGRKQHALQTNTLQTLFQDTHLLLFSHLFSLNLKKKCTRRH